MTKDYTLLRVTLHPGKYGYVVDMLATISALRILRPVDMQAISLYKSVGRRRITRRFLSTVSLCKITEDLTW